MELLMLKCINEAHLSKHKEIVPLYINNVSTFNIHCI